MLLTPAPRFPPPAPKRSVRTAPHRIAAHHHRGDDLAETLYAEIRKRNQNELLHELDRRVVFQTYLEKKREILEKSSESTMEALDALCALTNMRADVAFNSALAEIMRDLDDIETSLRAPPPAPRRTDWAAMRARSNEGLFFKSLYSSWTPKEPAPPPAPPRTPAPAIACVMGFLALLLLRW